MINNFVGIGRTTADVEMKYAQTGTAIVNFTLAITRRFDREKADFIRCVAFKKTAELIAQYVKKGHQIGIEGSIQTGHYEDKDGKRVYTTDVIVNNVQFLESKSSNQSSKQQSQVNAYNKEVGVGGNDPFQGDGEPVDISESDLPF